MVFHISWSIFDNAVAIRLANVELLIGHQTFLQEFMDKVCKVESNVSSLRLMVLKLHE